MIFLVGVFAFMNMIPMRTDAATLPKATYNDLDATTWTIGFKQKLNSLERGVQGSNGWYCLYTTETNKKGSFDLNKMELQQWTRTSNCWKFYGVAYNWSPGIYLEEGYDFSGNSNWWRMDGNGRLDTNVAEGEVSGAYAWAAPRDDNYQVTVAYVAGGGNQTYDGIQYFAPDGVTISINTKKGVHKVVDAPATTKHNPDLSQGTIEKTVRLKQDELVYIIVDPQEQGDYDYAQLQIYITTTDEEPLEDENGTGTGTGDDDGIGEGEGNGNGNEAEVEEDDETGVGKGDGTGIGNGEGNDFGSGEDKKVPLGKTDTPLLETTDESEDVIEDTEKVKEELEDESLFTLSDEAAQRLTLALGGQKASAATTTQGGSGKSKEATEVLSTEFPEIDVPKIVLAIIAVFEIFVAGIVFGAGRFHKNV